MVASVPYRENQIAAGVVRISEPLPAARPVRRKCSAAATSHGRPEPRTARVWMPTSGGPAAAHVRKRSNRSASSRPPRSTQGRRHEQRHLRVVGELARLPPGRAAAHLGLRARGRAPGSGPRTARAGRTRTVRRARPRRPSRPAPRRRGGSGACLGHSASLERVGQVHGGQVHRSVPPSQSIHGHAATAAQAAAEPGGFVRVRPVRWTPSAKPRARAAGVRGAGRPSASSVAA